MLAALVKVGAVVCLALAQRRGPSYRAPAKKSALLSENHVVADDTLVTAVLYSGKPQLFFYLLQHEASYLTFVVTPCSAPITWTLRFRSTNDTGKVQAGNYGGGELWGGGGAAATRHTHESAKPGLYVLEAATTERAAGIQLYASRRHRHGYPGLDHQPARLHLLPGPVPGQMTLAWRPSAIDAGRVVYWVAVSGAGHARALCAAGDGRLGIRLHPAGRATRITLRGLPPGRLHYFDVFAQHQVTNVSFVHASGQGTYHKPKPTPLREGKPVTADLQILDGKANFRYKVKEGVGRVEWYVEVCGGGSVEAEVRRRKSVLVGPVTVRGLQVLALPAPAPGARYVLRVAASDPEQLARIHSIEVMGSAGGLPVAALPVDRAVHEYRGLRTCRSVTLGWRPAHDDAPLVYCLRATLTPPQPDPCALPAAFNSLHFASLQCHPVPHPTNKTIMTEELSNLKPGRTYFVQVTVRRAGRGKMSAYDTIQVHTRAVC